jgi:predicted transport protein
MLTKLCRFENFGRKERVQVDEYTIEHILPQNRELSAAWREALGPDWQRVQEELLHKLGNLTLTGYNAEYSDRPFAEKRDMRGGFRESPLRLNAGLGQLDSWDEAAIRSRAGRLASQAAGVWSAPTLAEATLDGYRPQQEPLATGYTLADHPQLLAGSMKELFEAFRSAVLALDPNVTEEFRKLFVSYKAEATFVAVIPQAKRLLVSLNLEPSEVNDPRLLCRDVSGMGRWTSGDVEIGISSMEELSYVLGLVRQSYDRQMGDSGRG